MPRLLFTSAIALLAATLLWSSGSAQARGHATGQTLLVRNTFQGSQMAGVVTMSYRSGGQTVRHTCSILQCVFNVPGNVTVSLTQRPHDSSKIRFLDWKVSPLGGKPYVFKKATLALVMKHGYTVTAEYTSAKH